VVPILKVRSFAAMPRNPREVETRLRAGRITHLRSLIISGRARQFAATGRGQKVSTLSASAQSFAASGGVVQLPLTFAKCSSVAPRATPQPCQT
jgi:hypothetical protein